MDEIEQVDEQLSFWAQHRFLVLIGLTIVISLVLVAVGLVIYNVSGAAQLDLSRPDYKSVSSQVVDDVDIIDDYSSTGAINTVTITQFKELFDEQATSASAIDAFGGDPLDPEVLEYGQGDNQ